MNEQTEQMGLFPSEKKAEEGVKWDVWEKGGTLQGIMFLGDALRSPVPRCQACSAPCCSKPYAHQPRGRDCEYLVGTLKDVAGHGKRREAQCRIWSARPLQCALFPFRLTTGHKLTTVSLTVSAACGHGAQTRWGERALPLEVHAPGIAMAFGEDVVMMAARAIEQSVGLLRKSSPGVWVDAEAYRSAWAIIGPSKDLVLNRKGKL